MATFFAVIYQGAKPVPIDIDPKTLNLDPALLEQRLTPRTKAILVVHLFGHPCDMEPVLSFARRHKLYVIEDCAEAHGATYNGTKVGGLGDIGCFSFYANKIITTGEGGMLTLRNSEWAARARNLRGLAFGDANKFMHKDVGYNYRMTNLQAAIGHAQFAKIEGIIAAKRRIAAYYSNRFAGLDGLELPVEMPYARNVYWMYHVLLSGKHAQHRDRVRKQLHDRGIETREGFIPYNLQRVFIDRGWTRPDECPLAADVAARGFYLPSGPQLSADDLDYVANGVCDVLRTG
jgi:perosamine synthetase